MSFAIKIENLCKNYPGRVALDHISFTVEKNTIHGLLGPNGAGKSTTLKILSGLLNPTSGKVEILGHKLDEQSDELKRLIGILPENPPLYLDMIVQDYLKFVCQIKGVEKNRIKLHLDRVLEQLKLGNIRGRLIGNLSKGLKQRVALAQAIVTSPELIILDEPSVGLDPASVVEMRHLLQELKHNHTIIMSGHILHEIELNCSAATIIHQGKVIISGPISLLRERGGNQKKWYITVRGELAGFLRKLEGQPALEVVEWSELKDGMYGVKLTLNDIHYSSANLAKMALEENLELISLYQEKEELEDVFLRLAH